VALSPYIVGVAILLPLGLLLLALARTEVGKYRFWILFFMLYTRIGRNEVLDNELRGMIRGHIQADPGIHYNELLRRITAGNGTVAHHLMILEREGIIKSRRDGGLRRFYPGEMKLTEVHVRLTGVQRLILDQVRRKEGLSQRTIAAALDIPYLTVNRQVRKMVSLGVLRLEWRGISSRCHIGDGWRTDSPGLQAGTDAFLQTMSTQD
jgi:predicted transcriptional regulator